MMMIMAMVMAMTEADGTKRFANGPLSRICLVGPDLDSVVTPHTKHHRAT